MLGQRILDDHDTYCAALPSRTVLPACTHSSPGTMLRASSVFGICDVLPQVPPAPHHVKLFAPVGAALLDVQKKKKTSPPGNNGTVRAASTIAVPLVLCIQNRRRGLSRLCPASPRPMDARQQRTITPSREPVVPVRARVWARLGTDVLGCTARRQEARAWCGRTGSRRRPSMVWGNFISPSVS